MLLHSTLQNRAFFLVFATTNDLPQTSQIQVFFLLALLAALHSSEQNVYRWNGLPDPCGGGFPRQSLRGWIHTGHPEECI